MVLGRAAPGSPWSMSRSIRASEAPPRALRPGISSVLALAALVAAAPAAAHGFGQRYDLPLPLALYLTGVAAAIVFSFVVVGWFVRRAPPSRGYPRLTLLARSSLAVFAWRAIAFVF